MKEYLYDVFLSFTGMDRELKTRIRNYLEAEPYKLTCYDSDKINTGDFRDHYCEGIDKSRVYLMILTDSLYNDPSKSGKGYLSEVRKEVNLALECEAANELNIVILCLSEFFSFGSTFHDYNDTMGWFFYTHTRSYSQVRGIVDGDGLLGEQTLAEIESRCKYFIDKRNAGTPVPSLSPKLEIAESKLPERKLFIGRDSEIDTAVKAFESGKQAVVLRGSGGMGKTHLATEIARRCNENGYLSCPQIVYIGECSEQDGLHTVTSSVSYTKSVYESLSFLSERDKFERKLSSLVALPEYVLLVIDNYNSIKQSDIADLIQKLKCRLLITTRARLEDDTDISVISVEKLDPDNAYKMFCSTYGDTSVDRPEFDELYRFVGGHTMTLCIIGKMMALHKCGIRQMISGMSDLGAMEERIDFSHNDHRGSDTIMGHLTCLFSMNDFSDGSKRILRSMSILETGMIETSVLMTVLKLKNRNDISDLVASGWLDYITQTVRGKEVEFLCIHPLISLLMVDLLIPTEDNVSEMVTHISDAANGMLEKMTYADATVLDEGLYFACRILARTGNKLPQKLWDSLVSVDHLLGDEYNTERKTNELCAVISNTSESLKITMYRDMVTLEQHPTRTEVIEKYLGALENNANDYKWVLRCLSVTMPHIIGVSRHHQFLSRALEKAVDAAIVYNDDFALNDLMIYTSFLEKEQRTRIVGKIKKYIKKRKAEGIENASILAIELYLLTAAKEGAESFISSSLRTVNDIMLDKYGSFLTDSVKHPLRTIKLNYISRRLAELDDSVDDPLAGPLKVLYDHFENAFESGTINARKIIEAMVQLQINRYENQLSLASMEDAVGNLLLMLKQLPQHAVSYEVEKLSHSVYTENISVRELSNLRIAARINLAYDNRKALEQSTRLLSLLRSQRPEGHPDIISAIISLADACCQFNERYRALQHYIEAFVILKNKSRDSAQLKEIAQKILTTRCGEYLALSDLKEMLSIALQDEDILNWRYHHYINNYAHILISRVRSHKLELSDPIFDELNSYFDQAFKIIKNLDTQTKKNYAYLLFTLASTSCNEKNTVRIAEYKRLLMKLHKCRTNKVSHLAYVLWLSACAWEKYNFGEKDYLQTYHQAIAYDIKKNNGYENALGNTCNMIATAKAHSLDELASLMIKKKSNLDEIHRLVLEKGYFFIPIETVRRISGKLYEINYGMTSKIYKKIKSPEDLYMYVFKKILNEVENQE